MRIQPNTGGNTMATLTPAYGRDYPNVKQLKADWAAGKDFIYHEMLKECYVNIKDCPPGFHQFRYGRNMKVTVIKVG
jgi:hypothetical protein